MYTQPILTTLFFSIPLASFGETILGAYVFHRHGDRSPKSLPPVGLTDLGYHEVFSSGQYLRQRYVALNTSSQIAGIAADTVIQSQITVSAPDDPVLMNSALGFLQGLYPPVGNGVSTSQTLRNGTSVQSPMQGYQLVPVHTVTTGGAGSESAGWLQGSTGCGNAMTSSNEYFNSEEYTTILSSTNDFYKSLTPVINGTFGANQTSFKNAYTSESYQSHVTH